VLLAALLRQDFPDLPPLSVDLAHSPNLLCCPRVGDAFHQHFNHITIDAVLGPARLEELICIKVRKLDDSGRSSLVIYNTKTIVPRLATIVLGCLATTETQEPHDPLNRDEELNSPRLSANLAPDPVVLLAPLPVQHPLLFAADATCADLIDV